MMTRLDRDGSVRTDNRHLLVKLVLFAILAVAAAAFVLDNTGDVTIGYILDDREIPLIVVLVGAMIVGAVLERLGTWISHRNRVRL